MAAATPYPDNARAAYRENDRDPLALVTNMGVAGAGMASVAISAGVHAFAVQGFVVAWFLGAFFSWQTDMQARIHEKALSENTIEIEPEKVDPPKPDEPKPVEPEKQPENAVKSDKVEAPAPAAAQAGAIIAAAPDPNEPVDLTNSFVMGTGDSYAGGKTDPNGTSKVAVAAIAAKGAGAPGPVGTGTVATVIKKDCAKPAKLRGGLNWDCPFPSEADTEQIDEAVASIEVTVNASGRVDTVRVTQDPGHGFGRAAKACAMSKAFEAAVGDDCAATTTTKAFRIRFNR